MRPLSIRLTAFQSFAEVVEIEFKHLEEEGVYVIAGETGSGKTTVLDAMFFALYGDLPGSRSSLPNESIRCRHADEKSTTQVTFIFEDNDKAVWRITRRPKQASVSKRDRNRKVDTAMKVCLEEKKDGEWIIFSDKKSEIDKKIVERIGLDKDQFASVVILPQGQVVNALKANTESRRPLFRQLFKTAVFEKATEKLKSLADESEAKVSTQAQEKSNLLNSASDQLEKMSALSFAKEHNFIDEINEPRDLFVYVEMLKEEGTKRKDLAEQEEYRASKKYFGIDLVAKDWDKQNEQLTSQQELIAKTNEIEIKRKVYERGKSARHLSPLFESIAKREGDIESLEISKAEFESDRVEMLKILSAQNAALMSPIIEDVSLEKLSVAINTVESVMKSQLVLNEQLMKLQKTKNDVSARQSIITKIVEDIKTYDSDIKSNEKRLPSLRMSAKRTESLSLTICKINNEYEKSNQKERETAELKESEKQFQLAENEVKSKTKKLTIARTNYDKSLAAKLSATLKHGEECPVCGSKNHSKKSPKPTKNVSEFSLEEIELELKELNKNLNQKDSDCRNLRKSLSSTTQIRSVRTIVAELKKIKKEYDLAKSASKEIEILKATSDINQKESSELRLKLKGLSTKDESDNRLIDDLNESIAIQQKSINHELGISSAENLISLLREFKTLIGNLELTMKDFGEESAALQADRKSLSAALDQTKFKDEDEAKKAILGEVEIIELEKLLSKYDSDLSACRSLLKYYKEQNLPNDRPLTAEFEDAKKLAKTRLIDVLEERVRLDESEKFLKTDQARFEEISKEILLREDESRVLKSLKAICVGSGGASPTPSLEGWVLQSYLEDVINLANEHMASSMSGKYRIVAGNKSGDMRAKSELDVEYLDLGNNDYCQFNSLSGGEQFQAALAFALGLGDIAMRDNGAVKLGVLFIDEGFGTLDSDTLEQTINTLSELRLKTARTVGLITHHPQPLVRLPTGIEVTGIRGNRRVVQPLLKGVGIEDSWRDDLKFEF